MMNMVQIKKQIKDTIFQSVSYGSVCNLAVPDWDKLTENANEIESDIW